MFKWEWKCKRTTDFLILTVKGLLNTTSLTRFKVVIKDATTWANIVCNSRCLQSGIIKSNNIK